MKEITASEYVKSYGLPSVTYVARKVGKHPQRLFEWYHGNFALFEAVVAGVVAQHVEPYKLTVQEINAAKFKAKRLHQ